MRVRDIVLKTGAPSTSKKTREPKTPEAPLDAALWKAADAPRSNMDSGECMHIALAPIFLEDISDAFEHQHAKLESAKYLPQVPPLIAHTRCDTNTASYQYLRAAVRRRSIMAIFATVRPGACRRRRRNC